MGKIVVSEFITLDGVFQDPGGSGEFDEGGWAFKFDRGTEGDLIKLSEVMSAGALLLGRTTYEGFAQAWPSMTDDVGFAEKMNSMPKYVVSGSLVQAGWHNTTVIDREIPERIAALKVETEGDILVNGSGRLLALLLEHGLVDELRLMVFPIIIGKGKRLFADTGAPGMFRLAGMQIAGETIFLTYEPRI